MKWIGQHIYDLVARFRNDVYLEDLSTTTETNVLVVDSTGKVSKTTVITGDVTGVTAGSNITVTNPTGPVPTVALSTNVDVAGTLDVTSFGTFDASVTVAGNVDVAGTLDVTSLATFYAEVTIADNVGIGTTSPAQKLDVVGKISLKDAGDSIFVGYEAGLNDDASANLNVGVGYQALRANTTGANNTAHGYRALYSNTTGANNSVVGYQALYYNTTSANNTAHGYRALHNNTTVVATLGTITGGSGYADNTYTGVLMTYVSGSTAVTYPTATIVVSGGVVTTVTLTSFGVGFKDTTTVLSAATANIGGTGSGFTVPVATISSGDSNTAIGLHALYSNKQGDSNTATGVNALYSNTTGDNNSATGIYALYNNTTGVSNAALGYAALYENTTGSSNTAIGRDAGRFIADGTTANTVTSNSVFLGYNTKALAISQTNQIVIGDTAVGLGSNTAILGNSSITKTQLQGNVGIGTATPLNKLDIVGSLGRGAPVTKTTNFTVAATENWLIMNGTATITITLPTASSFTGRELMIKNIAAYTVISASSNVKPIDTDTAATAILPATAGSWCTLVSDGTNWVTMMN